ncbi:MAG TPA: hypothetical protein GXZ24_07435 [Firmicutes bacterium]|jgi:hypothetical protein|nr:hypothetical protein [Bacillota bacterium]
METIIIFIVFLILSSLLRSFSGAAKKNEGSKRREIIIPQEPTGIPFPGIPHIPDAHDAPDNLSDPQNPPDPQVELSGPEPFIPARPGGQRGGDSVPARRRTKPKSLHGLRPRREQSYPAGAQVPGLEELFYGEKLPLAVVSAVVLSPPKAKRPFRQNL